MSKKTSLSSPAPRWNPAIFLYSIFYQAIFKSRSNHRKKVGNIHILHETDVGSLTLTVGPHWYGPFIVVLMIAGGTFMNLVFIDNSMLKSKLAMDILVGFFCLSTLLTLMLTACADPGIVRTSPVPQCDSELAETEAVDRSSMCDICNILQLDGMNIRHCFDCGVCIEGHDHHCPWMGKCIGKKNMK
jgi:hypothetical protein